MFGISAINGEGTEELVKHLLSMLAEMPAPQPIEHEEFRYEKEDVRKFTARYDEEDGVYVVDGPIVRLLERNVILDDMDSLAYMHKTLKDYGVLDALRKLGVKDGDTVLIGTTEFDYID